jgi:hypothetical protein
VDQKRLRLRMLTKEAGHCNGITQFYQNAPLTLCALYLKLSFKEGRNVELCMLFGLFWGYSQK